MKHSKTILIDSAMIVPCPRWLQRHMLRNLNEAKRNKLNPRLAKRAEELLEMIEPKSKPESVAVPVDSVRVGTNAPAPNIANNTLSRRRWLPGTALRQCISRFFTSVKQVRFLRSAHPA